MEISAPSAQRQQIAEIEKQTKEQSQVHYLVGDGSNHCCGQGFGSGSAWIRINLSCWIRIQDGKNDPKKLKLNFHLLKCWMFSFEN
jgi:hypothetical protein